MLPGKKFTKEKNCTPLLCVVPGYLNSFVGVFAGSTKALHNT
jgi:hypothetical protein